MMIEISPQPGPVPPQPAASLLSWQPGAPRDLAPGLPSLASTVVGGLLVSIQERRTRIGDVLFDQRDQFPDRGTMA